MEGKNKLFEAIAHALETGVVLEHHGDTNCASDVAASNFKSIKAAFDNPSCMASMTIDAMGINRAIYGDESEDALSKPVEYDMRGYEAGEATMTLKMHKAEAKLFASMIAFCTAMYQMQPAADIPWMKEGEVMEGKVVKLDDILGNK